MGDPGDRARELINLSGKTGKGGVPYAAFMTVKTGKELWFRSWSNTEPTARLRRESIVAGVVVGAAGTENVKMCPGNSMW